MKHLLLCVLALALCAAPAGANVVWEWDASNDPTADGSWVVRGGGTFDTDQLDNGIWHGGHTLDTRPLFEFNDPFTVDITWQTSTDGMWDALFWVNADVTGGQMAALRVFLDYDSGTDTQTVTLSDGTTLKTITGLPNALIDTHLAVNTATDQISISVDGTDYGTYTYALLSGTNADMFATVLGGTDKLDVDYVKIEVIPEPATMLLLGGGLLSLVAMRRRKK